MIRLYVLFLILALGYPSNAPAEEKMCTQMGCVNGLTVQVPPEYHWQAGSYQFLFALDRKEVRCSGTLPFASCNRHITCSPSNQVQITESGCALPASAHGFSDMVFSNAPLKLSLRIERNGTLLTQSDFSPIYQTARPNGAECEPVCRQAHVLLTLPPHLPN